VEISKRGASDSLAKTRRKQARRFRTFPIAAIQGAILLESEKWLERTQSIELGRIDYLAALDSGQGAIEI
jgi:hypothetical protein